MGSIKYFVPSTSRGSSGNELEFSLKIIVF